MIIGSKSDKLYDFKIVASFACPSISETWPQFF
jgi:hypothetical protein